MRNNPEELDPSLLAGLQTLLAKVPAVKDKNDSKQIDGQIGTIIDLLDEEDVDPNTTALAILEGIDLVDETIQKNETPFKKGIRRVRKILTPSTQREKHIRRAKQILKSQGKDGVKLLVGKLRWKASQTECPIESAKITQTIEETENLLNQKGRSNPNKM